MRWFRDLKIIYYVAGAIMVVLVSVCGSLMTSVSLTLLTIELVILLFILYAVLNIAGIRRMNSAILLMNQCHVRDALNLFAQWNAKNPKAQLDLNYRLNWAACYLNYGDYQSAGALMEQTVLPAIKPANATVLALYYNNDAAYHLRIGNLERAQQLLEKLEETLAYPKLNPKARNYLGSYLQKNRMVLEFRKGSLNVPESYFLEQIKKEPSLLAQAGDAFWLGQIYLKQGRKSDAETYLKAAVHMGGDSYAAVGAQQLLNQNLEK